VSQKHERQRVGIKLNAHEIAVLELKQPGEMTYSINIPANILRKKNVLILDLPDSVSPARLRVSQDSRRLGIAMQWFLFE
jgi:hypothetical protein